MDRKHITRLILGNYMFLLALLIFVLNEFFIDFKNDFIQFYLNDLLAPVIILTLTQFLLSLYLKRHYIFSKRQLIFFFMYLSFCFEYFFPMQSEKYVADVYDLVAYAIGVLIFHHLINRRFYAIARDNKVSKKY